MHQDKQRVPGIKKIKKVNFLSKNKSKIIMVLTYTKEKKSSLLKKQIINSSDY